MKTKILVTLLVVTILWACGKDKYTTKPQLTFKSVNTNVLSRNQSVVFSLEVTDAEGDVQDSIWIQKVVPRCPFSTITLKYKLPEFNKTKDLKGEIEVCFGYGINLGCPSIQEPQCSFNDTATFKFWVSDKEKNVSDTVSSDQVVLVR